MESSDETRWEFHSYEREIIDHVWQSAQCVLGNDPALWRKDECGAWIHRLEYGNRHSQFGWEIYDPNLSGIGLQSLRALQWQNYQDKIAFEQGAQVTADGLRNVRRML